MEFMGTTACDTLQRIARQNLYVLSHMSTLSHVHSVALRCSQWRQNVTTVRPPKNAARLTSTRVESLKPTKERYEIGDTEVRGLQLRVAPTGVKSWHWRFYWQGKQVRLVLGTWPKTSLATAHEQAASARELLRKGIDPRRSGLTRAMRVKAEKPPSSGVAGHSVAHLAAEFMARHVKRQRRRPEYVQRILDANVLPRWANRDARTIKPREVIELLDEIADRAPVMANRVAGLLSQMFRFGIHRSILDTTPVQLLYRPGGKEKPRARVFSEEELKAFITNLDDACRFPAPPARAQGPPSHVAASQRARPCPSGASSISLKRPGRSPMRIRRPAEGTSFRSRIGHSRNSRSSRSWRTARATCFRTLTTPARLIQSTLRAASLDASSGSRSTVSPPLPRTTCVGQDEPAWQGWASRSTSLSECSIMPATESRRPTTSTSTSMKSGKRLKNGRSMWRSFAMASRQAKTVGRPDVGGTAHRT